MGATHISVEDGAQREEKMFKKRCMGGGGRSGKEERGIVSSHCSIKSVGNDQDEMMAAFLFIDTNLWLSMK